MPSEALATGGDPFGGGGATWTVDGARPQLIVTPTTPLEAAGTLADAAADGLTVAPLGGGTALALGNPPERLDLGLSTARLTGVIDYEPTDLVLSVAAGTRLGDVQAVLAEHGQGLPIDPPRADDATIGGLIATALTGPKRLGAGTLRDLLIGISVAHPSGTVTKAGGMVVKNVTGYDLSRLYHGSLGTLGVVVSANFKVLPLPRVDSTVLVRVETLDAALEAAGRVRASRLQPDALEAARFDGGWLVAVRLQGREGTVRVLDDETRALLGGDPAILWGNESVDWWRRYADAQAATCSDRDVLVRCAVRPRTTDRLVHEAADSAAEIGATLDLLAASVGLGLVTMRLTIPAGSDGAALLAALQRRLLNAADHVVILAAPPAWNRGLDVWGRPPPTLDVMRTLKQQFDPARVLNPGRFAGGI